jgi:hypothetical protein
VSGPAEAIGQAGGRAGFAQFDPTDPSDLADPTDHSVPGTVEILIPLSRQPAGIARA